MVYARWVVAVVVLIGADLLCLVQGQCAPLIQSVISPSSRQLKVTWKCLDGGTSSLSRYEYQVNYQLTNIGQCQLVTEAVGDGFSRRVPVGRSEGSAFYEYSGTFFNLEPYSSYSVSVTTRIVNTNTRVTGTPHSARTDEEAPGAAPANVRVTLATPNRLHFAWEEVPCMSRHGVITGYTYALYSPSYDSEESTDNRPEKVYSSLTPETGYTFIIAARTSAGLGPQHVLNHRTPTPLSLTCPASMTLTALSGQTSASVTYSQPTVTGGTLPYGSVSCNPTSTEFDIGTHEVTCTVTDGASARTTCTFELNVRAAIQFTPPPTAVTFTDVSASTEHTFSVSSNTVIGSRPVANLETTTLEAALGTVNPSGIKITTGSQAGSVVIAWQVPVSSHRDVIFYHIRYWKAEEVNNVVNQQIQADKMISMYTINGLEINSNYHFQIQAETEVGKGSWSEMYVFTILAETEKAEPASGINTRLIVGASIAAIVVIIVLFIVAGCIGYRLKRSGPNITRREAGDVESTEIGMSSRNQVQKNIMPGGNDDDGYDNPDPHDPGQSTSGYYEDLDKTTMNKDQEYRSIDNN